MDYQLASLNDDDAMGAEDEGGIADITTLLQQASWALKIGTTYIRMNTVQRTLAGVSLVAAPSAMIAATALHASRQHGAGNVAMLIGLGAAVAAAAIIIPAWRS